MTTSGTATFDMNLTELVEEAFERAGQELRSGYDLRTARRSLNIMFAEWANRGINMWTIESGSMALTQGTATYTLPADTVDLLEHVIRQNVGNVETQTDLTITRISVSTYASIPNKLNQARPIQIYINRARAAPTFTLWPVPPDDTYTLAYWRLRRIQDAGNGVNTMDVPFRFIPVLVAGLAWYLALKIPGSEGRVDKLKEQYDEAWVNAASEDREKASVRFVPRQQFIGNW